MRGRNKLTGPLWNAGLFALTSKTVTRFRCVNLFVAIGEAKHLDPVADMH